ncbi:MAG: hypothetical protein U9R25_17110 [Chloroflexota bacterium]|nr:hypothetical protein [Chloroflexota bacterium]
MSDTALKNMYNRQSVAAMAGAFEEVYAGFDGEAFLTGVFDDTWEALELKGRMRQITIVLQRFLPEDYPAALAILQDALPLLGDYGFEKMVFPDYVEVYGLDDWQAHDADEIRWITRHGPRTLLKQGRPEALELLGYPSQPAIAVGNVAVEPPAVAMGGTVTISFDIESLSGAPQNLMIDYVVHLMRANGKQTAKVFKLAKRTIGPGEVIHITKRHSFKPVTTRRYYPGAHAVEPKINGKVCDRIDFVLG